MVNTYANCYMDVGHGLHFFDRFDMYLLRLHINLDGLVNRVSLYFLSNSHQ